MKSNGIGGASGAEYRLINDALDAILDKSPAALKDMDKLTKRVQRKLRGQVDASVVRHVLVGERVRKSEPIEPTKRVSLEGVYLMRCDKCGYQLWYKSAASRACEFEHEKPLPAGMYWRPKNMPVKMISCTGVMHAVPKPVGKSFGSWAQLDDQRIRMLTNG